MKSFRPNNNHLFRKRHDRGASIADASLLRQDAESFLHGHNEDGATLHQPELRGPDEMPIGEWDK